MTYLYILNENREPVPCDDMLKWGGQFADESCRRVAFDRVGIATVSTVFLGLDYGFGGSPLLFETMVFNWADDCLRRYSTWADAEAGHQEVVALLRDNDLHKDQ